MWCKVLWTNNPAIFGQKPILSRAGRYQLKLLLPFNFTYRPKNLTTKIMVKGQIYYEYSHPLQLSLHFISARNRFPCKNGIYTTRTRLKCSRIIAFFQWNISCRVSRSDSKPRMTILLRFPPNSCLINYSHAFQFITLRQFIETSRGKNRNFPAPSSRLSIPKPSH